MPSPDKESEKDGAYGKIAVGRGPRRRQVVFLYPTRSARFTVYGGSRGWGGAERSEAERGGSERAEPIRAVRRPVRERRERDTEKLVARRPT